MAGWWAGDPAMALRADGFAAAYNDAGMGIENAGCARLPALQARGIAAITVSAASARIGEARSTLQDGVVSAANDAAMTLGAAIGMPALELLLNWGEWFWRSVTRRPAALRAPGVWPLPLTPDAA